MPKITARVTIIITATKRGIITTITRATTTIKNAIATKAYSIGLRQGYGTNNCVRIAANIAISKAIMYPRKGILESVFIILAQKKNFDTTI